MYRLAILLFANKPKTLRCKDMKQTLMLLLVLLLCTVTIFRSEHEHAFHHANRSMSKHE